MDLLQVTDNGQAIVHAKRATVEQLREAFGLPSDTGCA